MLAVGACTGFLALVPGPGAALAQSDQIGTSPAADVVSKAPFAVSVTFDRPLRDGGATMAVMSAAGDVGTGPVTTSDRTLRRALKAGAPGGAYVVAWSAVSADGQPVQGTFRFTAARPNAEPALAAGTSPSPSVPPRPSSSAGPRPAGTSGGIEIASTPTMASPAARTRSAAAPAPGADSDDGASTGFTLVPLTLGAVLVIAAGVVAILNKRRARAS